MRKGYTKVTYPESTLAFFHPVGQPATPDFQYIFIEFINKIMNFRDLFQIPLLFLLLYFSSTICMSDFNHVESAVLPLGKNAIINNIKEDLSQREMTSLIHVVQQVGPFLSYPNQIFRI